MSRISAEPETILIKNYEVGSVTQHTVKLRNSGSAPGEVTVHGEGGTSSLEAAMWRVVGVPRHGERGLVVAPDGGEVSVEVEFRAPNASSKQARCHSHTFVFEVAGASDLHVPVRATPAPAHLFESPPPKALDFGRVQLFSKPRRAYRFRCALGGKHRWRLFASGTAAAEFRFEPEEGTLLRGDALPLSVAWDAARTGQARCKLDIVVTSLEDADSPKPVIRRFSFDVSGTAFDPNELPPPVALQQAQPAAATASAPASAIDGKRPKPKAKKRAPRDARVVALEASFRKEMADAEEQLAQRQVRTTRAPGIEAPSPEDVEAMITAERAQWEVHTQPPVASFSEPGRPLLHRPTDPLPRPPPGQAEAETAGAPVLSRRDQSLWRFRIAARTVVTRVRISRKLALVKDFLATVEYDRERIASAVASLLPLPRRLADASRSRSAIPAAREIPEPRPPVFDGLPRTSGDSLAGASDLLSRLLDEPSTSLLPVTSLFDPYDVVELLPVATVRTERYVRESAALESKTTNRWPFRYPHLFADMQLRTSEVDLSPAALASLLTPSVSPATTAPAAPDPAQPIPPPPPQMAAAAAAAAIEKLQPSKPQSARKSKEKEKEKPSTAALGGGSQAAGQFPPI